MVGIVLLTGLLVAACVQHSERTIKAERILTGTRDTTMSLWGPIAEWTLNAGPTEGNPFDVIATAVFEHVGSGKTIATELFFTGNGRYAFRFTPTVTGQWRFETQSMVQALDNYTGRVTVVKPEPESGAGFVTSAGSQWARSRNKKPFVPQLVMYRSPRYIADIGSIRRDIRHFIDEQGFNGFHVPGSCHWFDIEWNSCAKAGDRNPDLMTFDALDALITEAYYAGATVHLWLYGDSQRGWNPSAWGLNGVDDRRLQRYIAARLGPLPGWTMGYGFDLKEWADRDDLKRWHEFMHRKFGWPHMLGGRSSGPNRGLDHEEMQIYEGLDYASYEHHQPDYDVYRAAVKTNPAKPVFSEDRFRIRHGDSRGKDYTVEMTRRGLWISTMAGGVANIFGNVVGPDWMSVLAHGSKRVFGNQASEYVFGNLVGDKDKQARGSKPYPLELRGATYQKFFADRFPLDPKVTRFNNQYVLQSNGIYLTYADDAEYLDLTGIKGVRNRAMIIAVDTKKEYAEIQVHDAASESATWHAPYRSDWAISATWAPADSG